MLFCILCGALYSIAGCEHIHSVFIGVQIVLCVAFMNNAGVNALCVFHVHFQSFITGSAPRSGTPASKDTCVFHSLETAEQFSRGAVHLPFPPAVRSEHLHQRIHVYFTH